MHLFFPAWFYALPGFVAEERRTQKMRTGGNAYGNRLIIVMRNASLRGNIFCCFQDTFQLRFFIFFSLCNIYCMQCSKSSSIHQGYVVDMYHQSGPSFFGINARSFFRSFFVPINVSLWHFGNTKLQSKKFTPSGLERQRRM